MAPVVARETVMRDLIPGRPNRLDCAVSDGRTWDRTRDLSRVKRALSR